MCMKPTCACRAVDVCGACTPACCKHDELPHFERQDAKVRYAMNVEVSPMGGKPGFALA